MSIELASVTHACLVVTYAPLVIDKSRIIIRSLSKNTLLEEPILERTCPLNKCVEGLMF